MNEDTKEFEIAPEEEIGFETLDVETDTECPIHLLATSIYGENQLLLVFEGTNNTTFNYLLSTGDLL